MTSLERIDRALALLVHKASARRAFAAGDLGALGLLAEDAPALASLDPGQIEQCAAGVRRLVLERSHRGLGTLAACFPTTVAAWRARHPDDARLSGLAEAFLDSPDADAWREGAACAGEPGLPVEECFYRFACRERLGDPPVRAQERTGTLLRALAISGGEPAFLVPEDIHRLPGGGWAAVAGERPPVLHAAVAGRYLHGAVTPLIAALVLGRSPPPTTPLPVIAAARSELTRLGLLL